jgi:hypothetical protein
MVWHIKRRKEHLRGVCTVFHVWANVRVHCTVHIEKMSSEISLVESCSNREPEVSGGIEGRPNI